MDTASDADIDTASQFRRPWTLPEKYAELPSREQSAVLRSSILLYLREHGSAARSVMLKDVAPPRADTFYKALDHLATTQQIYLDSTSGSRDPTYRSNGRLAHPSGQRTIDCIRYHYVIRSYDDRWAGKAVTITQYAVLPSGDKNVVGGIRVDREDLPELVRGIKETYEALLDPPEIPRIARHRDPSSEG